jgi:hypothetical protein
MFERQIRIETNDIAALNRELLQAKSKYARPGIEQTPLTTKEMKLTDRSESFDFFRARR